MKKNIFSILMLLLTVTVAWAGDGDGSKDNPFTGEWLASELAPKLDKGKYLAYDCDIRDGNIFVTDSKLNKEIVLNWQAWSPGNVLGSSDFSGYDEYYKANSLDERRNQLFIITDVSKATGNDIVMSGYFSGYYDYAGPMLPKKKVGDVDYYVINSANDYETFRQIVATGNPYANAVLEADINVTEPIGSGDAQFHYRGTFDGQEHTITVNMDNKENQPWGLFQYTEPDCVIKNLNVSGLMSSKGKYMGSIVGQATGTRIENCSSDITLKNSESTDAQIGGFIGVGYGVNFVTNCSFTGSIETAGKRFGVIGSNPHTTCIKDCSNDKNLINTEGSTELPNVQGIPNTDGKGVFFVDVNYELDTQNKIAKVTMVQASVKAVHVAETIHYNGNDYTVKYIGEKAFKGSEMEYCYIPKTVNNIADDAFNGCTKLKYLHIADCPSQSETPDDKLWLGINKDKNEELFFNSPLEKVYIGRDLRWETGADPNKPDEPFEDRNSITDVIFGPRVSRVGNYCNKDAREGWSYDLFNDCKGIKRVYIMGDDQSLSEKDLEFYCVDGLGYDTANDYYINRNIKHTDQWEFSLTSSINGCLDHCKHATYGPFVRKVTERSFKGQAANNNRWLETVDFTNAFRLETIGENAFNECSHIDCALDFSNTQLKVIEHDAFYNVDKVTEVNFGSHLEKIGAKAFNDSERITTISLPGTVTEVGDLAFGDMGGLSTIRLEDGDGHIKFLDSGNAFNNSSQVSYIYQGRDYEYSGQPPFADCSETTSVTIGPKVTKLNYNGYKDIKKFSITFLYSPTALTFEQTPAEVFYKSKVRGMFIDRQLLDKNGAHIDWSEGNASDDTYSTKKNVENLSFGDHITAIPEHLFDNFSALKSVIIPASVTEIGKQAFFECGKLENLCILGDAHIGSEAFARCTNLKHLFLMGQTAKLDELVFDGCNNIEEVVTGFLEASDKLAGSETAFTSSAYGNAHLVCAGDTREQKIDFGSINPWTLFKSENRSKILTANDYDIEVGDEVVDDYDHGYMPHSFTKDKFELVYAPFQMDSYYFGPAADIYQMSTTIPAGKAVSTFEVDYTPTTDAGKNILDIKFTKVDIKNEKLLPRNVYLVSKKTDKAVKNIASYHNLYMQQTVPVNNSSFDAVGGSHTLVMSYSNAYSSISPITPSSNQDAFVCSEGVLKFVNGNYQPNVGELKFYSSHLSSPPVLNMRDGDSIILSSKIDLTFNKLLEGYSTFYAADFNYIAPDWCAVYIITGAEEGESITLEEISDRTITKGQAVLLKANKTVEEIQGGLTEYLTYATHGSSCSYDGNLLKGVDADTPANQLSTEGFVYVLSCNSNYQNAGFYRLTGDKIMPAGKAYLDPSGLSSQQLAKSCLFTLKDTATGIVNPNLNPNPNLTTSVYDLMGRRLKEAGFKGVYIVNGKKVVIK